MVERLLVLGGSRQAAEGLRQLEALGLELVVCDMDPQAPGFAYADHAIYASVYHLDECLPAVKAFHERTPISGVMCLACDAPHIVAAIAEALGLPGLPLDVAERAVDKMKMKVKFSADGVAVPDYWEVASVEDIQQIMLENSCELVVKPVDSRGSKGVTRVREAAECVWSFSYAQENSPTNRVMVERYLSGPQVSTESIVINGEAITPALSDRSYEFLEKYYPFIVENGGDMPTNLPPKTIAEIKHLVDKAAKSLGVENGVVKGDIVVHGGKPYVIELAARLSGGYFCTHQIPFSTDVYLVEAAAKVALGETLNPADWQAKKTDYVSTRWKIIEPGLIEDVPDSSLILQQSGVLAFEQWLEKGAILQKAQNAAASVAMVQARGASQQEARENAENALKAFEPVIVPAN